ncbi:MAG: sulfite exporter TauE/SafE family protein [Candidatus Margulisiibacteriota bacterium]
MDFSKLSVFFLQGIILGYGPCLLSCVPILVPYIGSTSKNWKEGFWAALMFTLGKFVVYILLATIFGLVGFIILNMYNQFHLGRIFQIALSIIVIIIGLVIIFSRQLSNPFCQKTQKTMVNNRTIFGLGVIVGLSPCLPLVGILTEIAILADKIYYGTLYGLAFGLGTLFSPLLLIGSLVPVFDNLFARTQKVQSVLQKVYGAVLVGVGIYVLAGI